MCCVKEPNSTPSLGWPVQRRQLDKCLGAHHHLPHHGSLWLRWRGLWPNPDSTYKKLISAIESSILITEALALKWSKGSLPCNLSTVAGPVVQSFSFKLVFPWVFAAALWMQGDHRLSSGPGLRPWAVESWGRLGAFVFRSALLWVILVIVWGWGIVGAFLSSPRAFEQRVGLS